MRYLSVCSGIEAASVAWHPLGWEAIALSEIAAFPRAILAHRYPDVPLHGDFTTIEASTYGTADIVIGGTPCQAFSVAGLRGGLADPRGNLALGFCQLIGRVRPRWVIWENVPGVLSSGRGRDFGSILGAMAELGYGYAWRCLDAQHFGVPQRRRRIFLVGHLGDWRRAAAVLFERHGLSGHPAPRRKAGEGASGSTEGSASDSNSVAQLLTTGTGQRYDPEAETLVPVGVQASQSGVRINETVGTLDANYGSRRHNGVMVPIAFSVKDSGQDAGPIAPTLRAGGHRNSHANSGVMPAIAFDIYNQRATGSVTGTLLSGGEPAPAVASSHTIRRLTPIECERLQGFPDDWTRIPWRGRPAEECPDGPRYKAIGNSMAVPVIRWLGERIATVEAIG